MRLADDALYFLLQLVLEGEGIARISAVEGEQSDLFVEHVVGVVGGVHHHVLAVVDEDKRSAVFLQSAVPQYHAD